MYKTQLPQACMACWMVVLALLLGLSAPPVSANITLSEFKATPQTDGSILVVWETATEFDTQAFNLYRANSSGGPWDQRVVQQDALGDGFTGATYQYRDTNVTPGVRYYYLLEELTSAGPGERAGPVNAGIGLESEPTSTATATAPATATRTPTVTVTTVPGGEQPPAPTATQQFTNTPAPAPSPMPGPEATWTPAFTPTSTPLPDAQISTPTPVGEMPVAPTSQPPAATQIVTPEPLPLATVEIAPTATILPVSTDTGEAARPTATPQVFAQATTLQVLQDAPTRLAPQPTPASDAGRNTRVILLLGGGAIALAGLLGLAGLLIWRASRPQ